MATQPKLKLRYEIGDVLGEGGMGLVYKARDTVLNRDVAVKALRNAADSNAFQLFQKECQVLASISHPNIVEIFDIGELVEDNKRTPFFVMPLLPGISLDRLIRESSSRLTVERCVEIFLQTCRGLHAAHEHGLVHRDLKPSNLFVMNDDSVKIIDFGVALMMDSRATLGIKGTLLYMAPEQIEMKPLSALSDVFSLGVVCYETLTGRRPFERATEGEVAQAILHAVPQPVSEHNRAVNTGLSRVIHKAMAKQPWHRFASAREFADALQKALRGEALEFFDPARIQPRIQRVRKALDQSDLQFAGEILDEIEAEGHVDPEISQLRREIDRLQRQKTVRQLLESARTRFEEDEYPLALQKIQEALQLDPENASALGLKATIETQRVERKMEDWIRLAHQHVSNHAYSHAREAIKSVLQLQPSNMRALQLLAEVDRREREYVKRREEEEQGYKAALQAWNNGEISSALSKMSAVLELVLHNPDGASAERSAVYQNFYNQVRSECDAMNHAHTEARKYLTDQNFAAALTLCEGYLSKFPDNTLFRALKFDIQEQQRQAASASIAEVDRSVETEPDVSRRVKLLEEALARYPGEPHFEQSLRLMREKRDLVNSIVAKSRYYEERSQFAEALGQWEILRTIYPQYPGLEFETERVFKRRDQQSRTELKARWISRIEEELASNSSERGLELSVEALREFPEDGELLEMEKACRLGMERAAQVRTLLSQAEQERAQGRAEDQIGLLRQAIQLCPSDAGARAALVNALTERARGLLETDWLTAEQLTNEALDVDPGNGLARSLNTLAQDRKRDNFVDGCLSRSRQFQTAGEMAKARTEIEQGLAAYPDEPRLRQRYTALAGLETSEISSREKRRVLAAETSVPTGAAGGDRRLETAATQPVPPSVSIPSPRPAPPSSRLSDVPATEAGGGFSEQAEVSVTLPKPTGDRAILRWVLPVAVAAVAVVLIIGGGLLFRHFRHPTRGAEVAAVHSVASPVAAPAAAVPSNAPSYPAAAVGPATPLPEKPTLPTKTTPPENAAVVTVKKEPARPIASHKQPSSITQPSRGETSPLAANNDRLTQINRLSNLAYQEANRRHYFSPKETNAIAYSQQILKLDPTNDYARKMIDYSVNYGIDLVHKAIAKRNFEGARETSDAMAVLLPDRNDVVALQDEVAPLAGLPVRFLQEKPAGSFLAGTLTVADKHLNFAGAVSEGRSLHLHIRCSDVSVFQQKTTIPGPQEGFWLQTKDGNYNFVPERMPASRALNALMAACSR